MYSYYKASMYICLNKRFSDKTQHDKRYLNLVNKIKISDKVRDFNYIIDKLIEVETLKSMLLNSHQSLCFNYI